MQAVDNAVDSPAPGQQTAERPVPVDRRARWRRLAELIVPVSYALLAVAVMGRLWLDPNGRVLRSNEDDHNIFLFLLAHAERVVFHGDNPFFTTRMNVPDGVNMMANTSIFALSLPVAPITHFLGVGVSMVLLLTLGLAGTAAAWYWVLSRHVVRSRPAAYVGGLWCGFAPTMVSHANGHINWVAGFVLPFVVWRTLKLREPGRAVRNGLWLALVIVVQIFINEEAQLFTAMALGVFVAAYAVMAWPEAVRVARTYVTGLAVAAGASLVVLGYPLWFQFFGPRHYRGLPYEPDDYVTDLASYPAFARLSWAGNEETVKRLSLSATEDNAFFGWPLLIVLVIGLVLLWRSVAVRAVTITALVFVILSLGPSLVVNGRDTGVPLPFAVLSHVPVLDLISTTRFAMVVSAVVGVLLALAADRMTAAAPRPLPRPARVAFWVALVAALLPVAPRPVPVAGAPALPPFIAAGMWRSYVPEGRTLVSVPLPEVTTGRVTYRWPSLALLDFAVPRGYFMGPANPPADLTGAWRPATRPTADVLRRVWQTGRPAVVGEAARQDAVRDLVFWRAAVVVLPEQRRRVQLQQAVTALLGREPVQVGGVWLWDVRDLPVPPTD